MATDATSRSPPSGGGGHRMTCGRFEYRIDDSLGRGSFAEVFKGRSELDEVVAIKRIHKNRLKKPSNRRLLEQEISVMKAIDHPNVVRLVEVETTADYVHLVLEYCDGGDLSHYIAKHSPMPEPQIAFFMNQLALALAMLREKAIVHRDLKPQNLLLSGPPDQLQLKIADFGFARQLGGQDMAATFCGSPLYMAPEVLEGDEYNANADLWSVGTIIYECLTGKPPFKAPSIKALKALFKTSKGRFHVPHSTSRKLVRLLRGLLQPDPGKRMSFEKFFKHPFLVDSREATRNVPGHFSRPEHFYGSAPRSPSPSITDSGSEPESIVVLSREPSSVPPSSPPSQDSFVVVDGAEVQVNMFADAVEDRAMARGGPPKRALFGAAALAPGHFNAAVGQRRGTPLTEKVLLDQIRGTLRPATEVMSVALTHTGRSQGGQSGAGSTGQVAARTSDGNRQLQALVLFRKALAIFREGIRGLVFMTYSAPHSLLTPDVSEAVQQVRRKFNECLRRVEVLRKAVSANMSAADASADPLFSAEEILYENAIHYCKMAAADEKNGILDMAQVSYSRAMVIFQLLIQDAEGPDRQVLLDYTSSAEQRLAAVKSLAQQQALRDADAHNALADTMPPRHAAPLPMHVRDSPPVAQTRTREQPYHHRPYHPEDPSEHQQQYYQHPPAAPSIPGQPHPPQHHQQYQAAHVYYQDQEPDALPFATGAPQRQQRGPHGSPGSSPPDALVAGTQPLPMVGTHAFHREQQAAGHSPGSYPGHTDEYFQGASHQSAALQHHSPIPVPQRHQPHQLLQHQHLQQHQHQQLQHPQRHQSHPQQPQHQRPMPHAYQSPPSRDPAHMPATYMPPSSHHSPQGPGLAYSPQSTGSTPPSHLRPFHYGPATDAVHFGAPLPYYDGGAGSFEEHVAGYDLPPHRGFPGHDGYPPRSAPHPATSSETQRAMYGGHERTHQAGRHRSGATVPQPLGHPSAGHDVLHGGAEPSMAGGRPEATARPYSDHNGSPLAGTVSQYDQSNPTLDGTANIQQSREGYPADPAAGGLSHSGSQYPASVQVNQQTAAYSHPQQLYGSVDS